MIVIPAETCRTKQRLPINCELPSTVCVLPYFTYWISFHEAR